MRVLGLALAGVLTLTASMAAQAVPLGPKMGPATTGPGPGIVQAWGRCGWGWHPVPGHWSQWRGGWVPSHCAPNEYGGSWGGGYGGQAGPHGGWGAYGGGQGPYGSGQGPYSGWGSYGNGWTNPQR